MAHSNDSNTARPRARASLLTLVAIAVLVGVGAAPPAYSAPLAPAKPSQTVTLLPTGTACAPGASSYVLDQRQNADGIPSVFSVPAKQVFVVTSYDFFLDSGPASENVFINLIVADAALLHISYVSVTASLTDSTGRGGGTVALPSGFPMKAGTRLCFQFVPSAGGSMIVHGFLTADK